LGADRFDSESQISRNCGDSMTTVKANGRDANDSDDPPEMADGEKNGSHSDRQDSCCGFRHRGWPFVQRLL
jgi:hypothetical protein